MLYCCSVWSLARPFGGNEAEAIGSLDQVRTHAGLAPYAVASTDPIYQSKYPTLKLAILHERRVELAFENQRLFDLLRAFTAEAFAAYFHAQNQDDYGLSNLRNCGVLIQKWLKVTKSGQLVCPLFFRTFVGQDLSCIPRISIAK